MGALTETRADQADDIRNMMRRAALQEWEQKRHKAWRAQAETAYLQEVARHNYPTGPAANIAAAKALLRKSRS